MPPAWLRALGRHDLPRGIRLGGQDYRYIKTFKHDFFAVTGLYEGATDRVVLKVGRQAKLLGLPMKWLGRLLIRHEVRLYQLLGPLPGVPKLVGQWGPTGLVHEYVEGRPLARGDEVDERFFPRLSALLDAIHAEGAAYVDLEKPENILLGADGRPYLFDFQISWYVPPRRGGATWPCLALLRVLQAADRYHLLKHWRRLRPEQLDAGQIAASYQAPFWIAWHRMLVRPWTRLRRHVLVWLGARSSAKIRSPG